MAKFFSDSYGISRGDKPGLAINPKMEDLLAITEQKISDDTPTEEMNAHAVLRRGDASPCDSSLAPRTVTPIVLERKRGSWWGSDTLGITE